MVPRASEGSVQIVHIKVQRVLEQLQSNNLKVALGFLLDLAQQVLAKLLLIDHTDLLKLEGVASTEEGHLLLVAASCEEVNTYKGKCQHKRTYSPAWRSAEPQHRRSG